MSCECPAWRMVASHPSVTTHPVTFFILTLVCLSPFCTCLLASIHVSSRSLLTSPFFTHVYIRTQREAREVEEKEKLTNSLKTEFQVSLTNWVSDARKIHWTEDKVCVCVCVCVCVLYIFQMCAPCHLDSRLHSVRVCVCVCVRVCAWVGVCVCYKIFEMFEVCHVDNGDYTVCLCVPVSVSVSVLP